MFEMTWEQKVQAMQALGRVEFFMREPGDWSVSIFGVSRQEGSMISSCGTTGTIEEAVDRRWLWATNQEFCLVINAMPDKRRAVRWNGFMWADVEEAKCQTK